MLENKDIKILIVDDEEETREIFTRKIRKFYNTDMAASVDEAIGKLETQSYHLVLCDLVMPGRNGLELLEHVKKEYPFLPVVVISGNATLSMVVKAMQMGAVDFLEKPVEDLELLMIIVQKVLTLQWNLNELRRLQSIITENFDRSILIGNSYNIQKLLDKVKKIASVDSTVLITGETGVGKEIFAELIVRNSNRKGRKFVTVNCGSVPESLLESMLFGHKKGAFTSAIRDQIGYFEEANGGTLFLDEVSETTPAFQTKLLRVLEKRVVRKIGDSTDIPIDVRILAATNRDLMSLVKENLFREDLYYRLNVVQLSIPPLRERPEDIQILSDHFMKLFSKQYIKDIEKISPSAMALLIHQTWKGNVRELKNAIEHSVIMTTQNIITPEDLPAYIHSQIITPVTDDSFVDIWGKTYFDAKDWFERTYIEKLLKENNGDVSLCATISGIHRQNLYEKFKKYQINPDLYRS